MAAACLVSPAASNASESWRSRGGTRLELSRKSYLRLQLGKLFPKKKGKCEREAERRKYKQLKSTRVVSLPARCTSPPPIRQSDHLSPIDESLSKQLSDWITWTIDQKSKQCSDGRGGGVREPDDVQDGQQHRGEGGDVPARVVVGRETGPGGSC